MQHLGGKLALESACRIALNCPARNTVGSMETQLREPDTRANVAAWVTYAASLSSREQSEHLEQCAKIDAQEAFITSCPLCNAIWKGRGKNRAERRERRCVGTGRTRAMKHARIAKRAVLCNPYDAYTCGTCPSGEDRAVRRHAVRLIEESANNGELIELAEEYGVTCAGVEGADLLREVCEAIEVYARMSLEEVRYRQSAPHVVCGKAKRRHAQREEAYWSALHFAWLSVLAGMFACSPPEAPHYFMFSIVALWRLDTTVPADKSSTLLVISMQRTPRAPQPCPCRGNIPAVVPMAD